MELKPGKQLCRAAPREPHFCFVNKSHDKVKNKDK